MKKFIFGILVFLVIIPLTAAVPALADNKVTVDEVDIETRGNISYVSCPPGWEVVSTQRHGLPRHLGAFTPRRANKLTKDLNEAITHLATQYTVTFKTPHYTVTKTLTIPGETVRFVHFILPHHLNKK